MLVLTIGNIYCRRVNPILVEVNRALHVRPECLKNRGRGLLSLKTVYVAAGDFLLVFPVGGSNLNPELRVPGYTVICAVINALICWASRAHDLLKANVKAQKMNGVYISTVKKLRLALLLVEFHTA